MRRDLWEREMMYQQGRGVPAMAVTDTMVSRAPQTNGSQSQQEHPRAVRVFPGGDTKVAAGVNRDFMILLQTMFQVLSHYLNGIIPDAANGQYDADSEENARWLQRAAGLEETGIMDRPTWDALSRLYEVFVVKDPEESEGEFTEGWG